MYRQFGADGLRDGLGRPVVSSAAIVQSGEIDGLLALERIGTRHSFTSGEEVYAEGDPSDGWYQVVSGTVRICKLMADGRRHIAQFCFGGDCFGLDTTAKRGFSAEAVGAVVVMRYPRPATDQLIDENPRLARRLRDMTLRDLAHAQGRLFLLGRMTASERVARFLIEMTERRDARRAVELPMSRNDIADYLGLTIETVCRVLSAFRRAGVIAIPTPHRIELRDRGALEAIGDA